MQTRYKTFQKRTFFWTAFYHMLYHVLYHMLVLNS